MKHKLVITPKTCMFEKTKPFYKKERCDKLIMAKPTLLKDCYKEKISYVYITEIFKALQLSYVKLRTISKLK